VSLPPLTANAWLRWDVVRRQLPVGACSVLEIGCGQGAVGARFAAAGYDYVGVEPDPLSAAVARQRLAALGRGEVRTDLGTLALDRTFDLVCAFEVLEHVDDDRAALLDWVALLRPGGILVLSVPAYAARFAAADVHVGHVRRYDPPVLVELARSAGLVDVRTILYGMPLGYLLEAARNSLARRAAAAVSRTGSAAGGHDRSPPAERTSGSGRWHQPDAAALTPALKAATAPFRLLQRAFPHRGTGLVLRARRPR